MSTITTNEVSTVASTQVVNGGNEKAKEKEKVTINFQEWWSGEKSLTSTVARRVGWENLADWLEDKDKVCTDGQDDGNIGFKEGAKSFAKGLVGGIPKAMIKHPLITAGAIAGGVALTVLTGGAAAPVLWGIGAVAVGATATTSIVKAVTADTDAEKKAALEGTGTAAASAALLGATYNTTMNVAKQAGVNTDGNILQTMKSSAEVSAQNAKGNFLTLKTGTVHAHSNELQGAHQYMSKANDVQAYRFNPNGTPEEILANNPGVFRGADGKYYLPNKWNSAEPYLIDPSKEQMIMLYGGDDMAVCDGAIFKGSYVDKAAFHAEGALNYQDPTKLQYGQIVDVTKQAPGAFKIMPEGTQIQTLEGPRTVQAGEVVALDHNGNPYVTTVQNIVKRNTGFSVEAQRELLAHQKVKLTRVSHYQDYTDTQAYIEATIDGKPHKASFLMMYDEMYSNLRKDPEGAALNWLLQNWDKGKLEPGVADTYGSWFPKHN